MEVIMKIGTNGLNLIKLFKGLKLRAYKCPADIWPIGYGHTDDIAPDDIITEKQAASLLCQDVAESERAINQYVHVSLTQNQFDALVSFVFNTGNGNFAASTLLKNLNVGDYPGRRMSSCAGFMQVKIAFLALPGAGG